MSIGPDPQPEETSGSPRQPLTRFAYEKIKSDILSRVLLPRESLVETDLAARYGMSKTPVREALLALSQSGLVESNAFRGWRVRHFGSEDARNIYQLREVLEPFALEQAVPRLTKGEIEDLRGLLSQARTAIEKRDLPELSELNRTFHARLVARCGNARMVAVIADLREQLQVMAVRTWRAEPSYGREMKQHEAIVQAIEAGDGRLASERLRAHILEFCERYVQRVEGLAPSVRTAGE